MVTGVSDFYLSKLFKEFFPESCESDWLYYQQHQTDED